MNQYAYSILFLLLSIFPLCTQAQTAAIRQFYRQQSRGQGKFKLFLSGWVVKLGIGIASKELGANKKIVKQFTKPLKNIRILTIENPDAKVYRKAKKMLSSAHQKRYKDLLMVRDHGTSVNILMKEKVNKRSGNKRIKGLLILVQDEDQVVLLSIKGRWELQKIISNLQQLDLLKKRDKLPLKIPKAVLLPPRA